MGNDKTKWIFDETEDDIGATRSGGFTESIGNATDPGGSDYHGSEASTRLIYTGERTTIYHAGKAKLAEGEQEFSETIDPVVGWLVIVKGPGLGQAVSLGAGVNAIGRSRGQRAALPFGDTMISSEDHARVYYDDDERQFYVSHGTGKNITRVNGAIVANPMPLENFALIQLTKATHLRFVAFCGPQFDWSEVIQKDGD